jgi:flagellar basal-body rod protein FlgC
MAENLFSAFKISGEGLSVQRRRLSATANNLANINTTRDVDGEPYKREVVKVSSVGNGGFGDELNMSLGLDASDSLHQSGFAGGGNLNGQSYLRADTIKDDASYRLVHDPSHPDADKEGYVRLPNINIVTEMVEMISAQRSFEANSGVLDAVKNMARDSLEI